jgi:hypothetical protein
MAGTLIAGKFPTIVTSGHPSRRNAKAMRVEKVRKGTANYTVRKAKRWPFVNHA